MTISKERKFLALAGAVTAASAFILVVLGNPGNMGFCIACFLRDAAGSLGLHSASNLMYMRPEILGLVLGAFIVSALRGEFRARAGSSPAIRFIIGFCVSVGALVFLGCPLRMVLRLSAGDLNALFGLAGFAGGVAIGCLLLNLGFSLGRAHEASRMEGVAAPLVALIMLLILLAAPQLLKFSSEGPGSMRAPIVASLLLGLLVGAAAQRSRLCFAGGIRDTILMRDTTLLTGFLGVFLVSLALNIVGGKFNPGFEGQAVAHTDWLWNTLGMVVVGMGSVMLGGCPLRQLILAGEGNGDSAVTVLGLVAGAAMAHNWGLASSTSGATAAGKAATVLCLALLGLIALGTILANRRKNG